MKKIKIFSDGADLASFRELAKKPLIEGFTTNPTLMRKAGVQDYDRFAQEVLGIIGPKPISFEVFADDSDGMSRQAHIIGNWGQNVYVKIPIVNSQGQPMLDLIRSLHADGVKLNITAILAVEQLENLGKVLCQQVPSLVSVFAGRIADTGRDPVPTIQTARQLFSSIEAAEILWASTREVLNIRQAEISGAHIITVTPEMLMKYEAMEQHDLIDLSRQTSGMFWNDAKKAGSRLD